MLFAVRNAVTAWEAVQMSYSDGMDHLEVLREKIGRLRGEIAHIQELNEQYRHRNGDATEAQVALGQRHERLQAIQHELAQLADLGRKVHSVEEMKEKHRHRMQLIKQARASLAFRRSIGVWQSTSAKQIVSDSI